MLGAGGAYLGPASPSRAASALASPRVRTSSLRRIAETWWSTVLRRDEQPLGDLGVAQAPAPRSASTSSSRAVRPAGFCRVAGRGPRGSPRAPRSRSRRATIAAAGAAPKRLQLVERAPQRLLVVGVRERQRRLVGAAELPPQLGRLDRMTGELQRVGLGRLRRELSIEAGTPPPGRELADEPRGLPLAGERERVPRLVHRVAVAFQPRGLGSRRRDRPELRQLVRGPCQRPTPRPAAATPPGRRGGRARAPARRATRCAACSRCGGCAGPTRRSRPLPSSAPGRARAGRGTRGGRDGTAPDPGRCRTRSLLPDTCSPQPGGAARRR